MRIALVVNGESKPHTYAEVTRVPIAGEIIVCDRLGEKDRSSWRVSLVIHEKRTNCVAVCFVEKSKYVPMQDYLAEYYRKHNQVTTEGKTDTVDRDDLLDQTKR